MRIILNFSSSSPWKFSILLLVVTVLSLSISPNVLASSNSGPGGGDRDDDRKDNDDVQVATQQNPSAITTTITIPQNAESHSASNPYTPNPALVSSGSTVTWHNVDEEDTHTATADDGSFTTGIISPGAFGQAIINAEPGSNVPYHCDVHPEMKGILQISAATTRGNMLASNTTASSESTGSKSTLLHIIDQPFAIGYYSTASENVMNNTIRLLSVVGNTTITFPNSTERVTTDDTGSVTITLTESGGAILEGQIYLTTEDRLENATITITEIFTIKNSLVRGIASFSTDSTGRLAPLDNIVAITLSEGQPDGSTRVSFFEWRTGSFVENKEANTMLNHPRSNNTDSNPTSPSPVPAASQSEDVGTIRISIMQGSASKTHDAFNPNLVQVSSGSTVTWTNDDTAPHTVTSGTGGQPDGKFDSSPNLNPLMAPGQTFSHTFEEAGNYPYYCAIHPNMVGTVSVS